jgi:hypothetical protein
MTRKVLAAAAGLIAVSAIAAAKDGLEYPKDWRTWTHSRSGVIQDKQHPLYGFHHVYASPKAMPAYKEGKTVPEGSQFAVPFYEITEQSGVIGQGAFKMLAVMKKDKAAKDTGGWRYGAFDPAGKPIELDVKTGCYNCHTTRKDADFLFSEYPK